MPLPSTRRFYAADIADPSPDIVERIDAFLDAAAEETTGEESRAKGKGKERVLGINQVLVNEYKSGQGISVSPAAA